MIKAVLLDLDDTLLRIPVDTFVHNYLQMLDRYFWKRHLYPDFARTLRSAVQSLSGQRDHRATNTVIILDYLTEKMGIPLAALREDFEEFYRKCYPDLVNCSEQVAFAGKLVDYLLQTDYAVVIATNPLFPPEAIRQRLLWAGVPDDFSSYALVTHSENMHFVKPNPAYYAEIVARVGVEPDEAIMIGDDPVNDIEPAARLGMSVYQVTPQRQHYTAPVNQFSGTVKDLYRQIADENGLETTLRTECYLSPEMIEPQLRGNIGALYGLLTMVQPHFWNQHPDPNEWSILQVVCHLWESEYAVQRPRLQRILRENNPFLVNPKTPEGPEAPICDEDGYHAADSFAAERETTLELLRNLTPDDWSRPARHSVFGHTTLLEMAHFMAQHDRLHITQLCQTLGKCS